MKLMSNCFDEHKKTLTNRLIAAGFSIEEVRRFLPEAALGLCLSSQKTSEFQTVACLFSKSRYQMLRIIDVDAIAGNCRMDSERVIDGLHAIAPLLLQAYAQRGANPEPCDRIGVTEEPA